jgi:hypothetical protein
MMKKYKSKLGSLRILVNHGGEIKPIEFTWDYVYPNSRIRGCSFATNDKELQKSIEAHEYFNRKLEPSFWTDDVEEVKETKEEVLDEPKKVKRYKSKE